MQYAIEPEFKKFTGQYNAACPICREGKSLGKKKRLFYYTATNTFHCFNCNKTWSSLSWIKQTTGMSDEDIQMELYTNEFSTDVMKIQANKTFKRKELPDLPFDSINLFDDVQIKYYSSNKFFNIALQYIKNRKLDTAINKSPNLFISLTDKCHSNRLCIPFYNTNKKVVFYQTRCLDGSEPRYLGKAGYDKSVFGIERVDPDIPYIFIFEGPIDSMFVKNGVAVAGINLTSLQEKQLNEFPFHKRIWVMDNPAHDSTSKDKIKQLLENNHTIFNWKIGSNFKDFNEWAIFEDVNEIDYQKIINNSVGV
jgi:hypothetical protein